MKRRSRRAKLNCNVDADFGSWSVDQIQGTLSALKSKAAAFNCTLRITSVQIRLSNQNDDTFSAVFNDDYGISVIEFNIGSSTIRGDATDKEEITDEAFARIQALNDLKQVWREVSEWLDLIAYAKKSGLNSSRKKLNSSVNYDYACEETDDGYFEGSIAGNCTGLSAKYSEFSNMRANYQFCDDVSKYISTAAEIISASQHNDNFEVEISAEDEDEFEDTVAEIIEFIKMQQQS